MLNTEWGLMIWTFITFGIAVLILWKFAFGPLQRVIDERRARIQESMDAAEETRAEAQRLLDEYKQTLAQVRGEAEEILERSRQRRRVDEGRDRRRGAHAGRARGDEGRRNRSNARRAPRCRSCKAQVAELTLLATEKVAASSLSEADQRRLIDDALAEMDFDQIGMEPNA